MHKRETERAQLQRQLLAGNSIHMPAPRRIGKTWTIGRLAEDLRTKDWTVVQMDVQGMRTARAFAEDLCRRIEAQASVMKRIKAHFHARITTLASGELEKPLDILTKLNPKDFIETLVSTLDQDKQPAVILIDEIAFFVLALAEADPVEAKDFVYSLRALQQRYRNVRWLMTGSIGLDIIARRYGLEGAFVDLQTFVLRPFTPAEARSLLRAPEFQAKLNNPFDADDADLDWMLDEIGWLAPYYLQMVANEVRPSVPPSATGSPHASRGDIAAAFDTVLQPDRRMNFAVWFEHVDKNFTESEAKLAFAMLARLSAHRNGERIDTLHAIATELQGSAAIRQTREVLMALCNDGLLTLQEERYAFQSGLVRRYWQVYQA